MNPNLKDEKGRLITKKKVSVLRERRRRKKKETNVGTSNRRQKTEKPDGRFWVSVYFFSCFFLELTGGT